MSTYPPAPPAEIIGGVLDSQGELNYVIDPAPSVLRALVGALDERTAEGFRLLVETEQLKHQVEDFLFGSLLANLEEREAVSVRTGDGFRNANLLLFEDVAVVLLDLDTQVAAVEIEDNAVRTPLETNAVSEWDRATPHRLRTPARSKVTETLGDELGRSAAGDFEEIVDSLETARGNGAGLDEVTIALLVAAKNEALLYDISKWGEDVGLASKATFSRTKSTLEELGLIATEKVPIDVGRPRLRLKFADERLRNASPDELASVAMGLMD